MVASGCARAYQSQSVLTASPGRLVLMLFDGALRFLNVAREGLDSREESPRTIERINTHLIKAQNILAELQATLDRESGGEFAGHMDRLYDYFLRRLLEANLKKDVGPVREVERLLREIRDAWADMLAKEESLSLSGSRGVA